MRPQPSFEIGGRRIGGQASCFVIAEIGINHGGDEALCARMIEEAAKAGADAVKLQTVNAEASYVRGTESYNEFRGKELSAAAYRRLAALSAELSIIFFSTPADPQSLELLIAVGVPALKVSSGLLTHLPMISRMAATGLPLIISTGMASVSEIDETIEVVLAGKSPFALLECTSLYPAAPHQLNLAAMSVMGERYRCAVGYSDHCEDDLACLAAVAMGATIVEKHFTLDRSTPGADHALSIEPAPFSDMVRKIRAIEQMRGTGIKEPGPEEAAFKPQRYRCLVAIADIAKGQRFDESNVSIKRPLPGNRGLPAKAFDLVIGKTARRAISHDQAITESDIA